MGGHGYGRSLFWQVMVMKGHGYERSCFDRSWLWRVMVMLWQVMVIAGYGYWWSLFWQVIVIEGHGLAAHGFESCFCHIIVFGRAWLWQVVVLEGHGYGRSCLWQVIFMAGHGYGRSWLWQVMVMAGHGYGRSWLWQVMVGHDFCIKWLWFFALQSTMCSGQKPVYTSTRITENNCRFYNQYEAKSTIYKRSGLVLIVFSWSLTTTFYAKINNPK